jgi:hypothetical protein
VRVTGRHSLCLLRLVDVSAVGNPIDAARKFRPMEDFEFRVDEFLRGTFMQQFSFHGKIFGNFHFSQKSFVAVQYRMGL